MSGTTMWLTLIVPPMVLWVWRATRPATWLRGYKDGYRRGRQA